VGLVGLLIIAGLPACLGDTAADPTNETPRTNSDVIPEASSLRCRPAISKLSFVSTRSGREQIYLLDIGRLDEVMRITRLPGSALDPSWSPDGRRVAFRWFRPRQDSVGIYVANVDGSEMQLLVESAGMPDWSPDGRFIAFANLHPHQRGTLLIDVDRALAGDDAAVQILQNGD
jgi:Tol biopolymer transport system component